MPTNVRNGYKREQSLEVKYEKTNCNKILSENTKKFKKPIFPKTFLCNRITMAVTLEAYLEPNETSTKSFFLVNN